MTAAERLLQLAGITGTAGALLASIGTGITAGAMLVSRSTLASATAAAHLLDAGVQTSAPSGGSWVASPRRYRPKDEDEALLLFVL